MKHSCLAVGGLSHLEPALSLNKDALCNLRLMSWPPVENWFMAEFPSQLRLSCSVWYGTSTLDRGERHLGARSGQAPDGLSGPGQPHSSPLSCHTCKTRGWDYGTSTTTLSPNTLWLDKVSARGNVLNSSTAFSPRPALGFAVSSSNFFQAQFWPLGQVPKIQGNLLYAINEV